MDEQLYKQVIIVGGGIGGLATAKLLSEQNIPFTLVEKSARLGGHTKDWACMATEVCNSCSCCSVFDFEDFVASSRGSRILIRHELSGVIRSDAGISAVKLQDLDSGTEREIPASSVVIAVGFEPFDPSEKGFWGYGMHRGVMTLVELNNFMRLNEFHQLRRPDGSPANLAFFQCVGSRDKSIGSNYCSQYCCSAAIRAALRCLYEYPDTTISIFYIDLQISGKTGQLLIDEAQKKGVRFVQGVPGEILPLEDGRLQVISQREGSNYTEYFDQVVLSVGQRPAPSNNKISTITGVPLNEFGFLQSKSELDSARTPVSGIYLSGTCSGPATIPDVLLTAGKVVSAILEDTKKTI
ncbi:MAG: FAD-dependent oxidoreductase [Desulfomonilaceae bacterium]